jgi:hypothetical protein
MTEPRTWRDRYTAEQTSLDIDGDAPVTSPRAPVRCAAPNPRAKGQRCGRPAGHDGDHMVVRQYHGPDRSSGWSDDDAALVDDAADDAPGVHAAPGQADADPAA